MPKSETSQPNCSFPPEVVEREVIAEVAAFRDERLLKTLSAEQRKRIGDNPVGPLVRLRTADFAVIGSITDGVGCQGTTAFTEGVTCKILKVVT